MSGVEGLGIVLGILPLLISAAEHYEEVFRPFKRFKDYAPEICRFQRRILAQKAIFRSQCQLLLIPLTDPETTTDMLNRREHEMWSSDDLGERLKSHLGQSAEACMATMLEIEEQLEEIQEKSDEFSTSMMQDPPTEFGKKAWRKRMKKRLKFSLSEPDIDRCVSRLRELNQDFTALSVQTAKLLEVTSSQSLTVKSVPAVKQCTMIQRASVELYNALGAACWTHNEHQAHLQVEQSSYSQPTQTPRQSQIRFCVGLSQMSEGRTASYNPPIWFAVRTHFESISEKSETACNCGHSMEEVLRLGLALQRVPSGGRDSSNRKRRKTGKATFREATPPPQPSPSPTSRLPRCSCIYPTTTRTDPTTLSSMISLPNFCIAHDLCIHISRIAGSALRDTKACFGRLTQSSTTHELYLESQERQHQQSLSFSELVAGMAGRRYANIERIRIARSLALAVLQFHSTPLLNPSWNGDDIIFFGKFGVDSQQSLHQRNDISDMPERLPEPHLRVMVNPKNSPLAEDLQASSSHNMKPRNDYLFRLGVALLELAYRAPLRSLRGSASTTTASDFEIADKYSLTVAAELGRRYAKVVRKCIGCDFGQDVDLSSQELRIAVHKEVVLELEGLVQDFDRKMNLST